MKQSSFVRGRPHVARTWPRVFAVPIGLGVLSLVGLLSALLGDEIWDTMSWLALGVPCVVIGWYWFGAGRLGGKQSTARPKGV